MKPLRILYLTYDGLLDPLGQSQVVSYLLRFSRRGLRVAVISFEKRHPPQQVKRLKMELEKAGITWAPLPYHKHPQVLSTAWDLFIGLWVSTLVAFRFRPQVVHARGYAVSVLALWVKRLAKARFLFDIRGFWPEEKVEAGSWKADGRLYRMTKRWERGFFQAADGVVTLSEKGKHILEKRFQEWNLHPPLVVIPTCVDLTRFSPNGSHGENGRPLKLAYAGSVGTWYLLKEMTDFFIEFRKLVPETQWFIFTNRSDPHIARELARVDSRAVHVRILPHEEVPAYLPLAQATLCFIKPVSSKLACCPTKVGESLACGIPLVVTAGTGDCDDLVRRERVGVVLEELTPRAYQAAAKALVELLQEGSQLQERCRQVASSYFDIEKGVDRYLMLYDEMIKEDQGSS